MPTMPPHMAAIRKRSGSVTDADPLVSFLYELMRDHVPVGTVEAIMTHVQAEDTPVEFCNGWLANYARDVARRLRDIGLGEEYESAKIRLMALHAPRPDS